MQVCFMFLKLVLGNIFTQWGSIVYAKMELFGQKVYYVKKRHPAIIDKEMWEAVQLEMK